MRRLHLGPWAGLAWVCSLAACGWAERPRHAGSDASADGICQKARKLERDGSYARARQAYATCVETEGGGFVDSHLGYQRILEVEDGLDSARDTYEQLRRESSSPMIEWAAARIQPRAERLQRLEALREATPDFAPVYHELSRQYSIEEVGAQSLEDKIKEKLFLGEFLSRAKGNAAYREYFTDYDVAAQMLRDAERRLERIGDVDIVRAVRPVKLTAMPSNAGWHLTFTVEEAATAVQSRKKGDGDYTEGWQLQLPLGTGKETVEVRYKDIRGKWHGPYELAFDPNEAMGAFVKQAMSTVGPQNWLAIESPTGTPNLYFTTVFVYRCGLAKVEYGIDVKEPNRVKALPACDLQDPYAIRDTDGMYEPVPEHARFVSVRLTFADGEVSPVHEIPRPPLTSPSRSSSRVGHDGGRARDTTPTRTPCWPRSSRRGGTRRPASAGRYCRPNPGQVSTWQAPPTTAGTQTTLTPASRKASPSTSRPRARSRATTDMADRTGSSADRASRSTCTFRA
jgi:hypothetical protein